MMFNATFINILVISWQSVLLVEETRENHKLTNFITYSTSCIACVRFKLTMLVVIVTDGLGSCKSNYHTIMTTTAPNNI